MRLTDTERRWAHAVLDAMFPRGAHPSLPLGIEDMDIDGYFDEIGDAWPAFAFFGLRLALLLVALAPIVVLRVPRLIHRVAAEQRVRVLDVLYASPIYFLRGVVILLKATGGILYGGHASVRAAIAPGHAPVATLRRKEVA